MTRLTGKIRIDKNDLTFAQEGLHGIVSYQQGKGASPRSGTFLIQPRREKSLCPGLQTSRYP